MMFEKVENIKRPLKIGEKYLVPCVIFYQDGIMYITPVINHPHNDVENGQKETHYHADYRFVRHKADGNFPEIINKHSKHYYLFDIRPDKDLHGGLEYFILPVINETFVGITPIKYIANSKLKHKCIHKGKCPHRGYDLSQAKPDEDGTITCPLHGLKFNAETGALLSI